MVFPKSIIPAVCYTNAASRGSQLSNMCHGLIGSELWVSSVLCVVWSQGERQQMLALWREYTRIKKGFYDQ
jgi:hypothetical protein